MDFLPGLKGGEEGRRALKRELQSLQLHPQAREYYWEAGLLPPPKEPLQERVFSRVAFFVHNSWKFLAGLVILIAGYRGLLRLRREYTSNYLGRLILAVRVDEGEPHSVAKLSVIRKELDRRVKRRWWQGGELNKRRWRDLHDLIGVRVTDAKETLTRALLAEVRSVEEESVSDDEDQRRRYAVLDGRIWKHLENGELNTDQQSLLLKLIEAKSR